MCQQRLRVLKPFLARCHFELFVCSRGRRVDLEEDSRKNLDTIRHHSGYITQREAHHG